MKLEFGVLVELDGAPTPILDKGVIAEDEFWPLGECLDRLCGGDNASVLGCVSFCC